MEDERREDKREGKKVDLESKAGKRGRRDASMRCAHHVVRDARPCWRMRFHACCPETPRGERNCCNQQRARD